jgi:hypothetical protein
MTNKSNFINLKIILLAFVMLFVMIGNGITARTVDNPLKGADIIAGKESDNDLLDTLLLSVRIEMIEYASVIAPVRENTEQRDRFYFNNIYINLEGYLNPKTNCIVEFQALTSELYLFGGFITVVDSLEGMGTGEPGSRQRAISDLVHYHIQEIDAASEKPNFERVRIDFALHDMFSIKIGKVRNPFGFWDDYSLFRNLSFIKTDPISLGVPLRRTDMGCIVYGNLIGKYLSYELGVLDGEYVFKNKDGNSSKDFVSSLGTSFYKIDFGINYYVHDVGAAHGSPYGVGVHFRYRIIDALTLLGEAIYIKNDVNDIETKSTYLQVNYDLSSLLLEGLRWNMFLEAYNSDLLKIDLEPDLDYKYAGTYFQASMGFVYSLSRNIDFGIQAITGTDEEGDPILKGAFKIDAKF